MSGPSHPELERLKLLLSGLAAGADDSIGLLLSPELHRSGYEEATPGVLVFATTGGDGVHFGFLSSHGHDPQDWPVVMTVPMALDCSNYVVGENLSDFLAMGLRSGYFVLEQLAYDPEWALAALREPEGRIERSALMIDTLRVIRNHFGLVPQRDLHRRLEWLKSAFALN